MSRGRRQSLRRGARSAPQRARRVAEAGHRARRTRGKLIEQAHATQPAEYRDIQLRRQVGDRNGCRWRLRFHPARERAGGDDLEDLIVGDADSRDDRIVLDEDADSCRVVQTPQRVRGDWPDRRRAICAIRATGGRGTASSSRRACATTSSGSRSERPSTNGSSVVEATVCATLFGFLGVSAMPPHRTLRAPPGRYNRRRRIRRPRSQDSRSTFRSSSNGSGQDSPKAL